MKIIDQLKDKIQKRTHGVKRNSGWWKFKNEIIELHPFCGACGTIHNLEVHHIIPVHKDKSKEMDKENCMVLCGPCHFLMAHFKNYKRFNVNIRADAAYWYQRIHELKK